MKIILSFISFLFVTFLLWLCIWVPIFGLHKETGRGEHTGYISATEKTGVFFKTGTAYLKTDTSSSQEDDYCVVDDSILSKLAQASVNKEHVNVKFFSWFSAGVENCAGEGAIIYEVETIK